MIIGGGCRMTFPARPTSSFDASEGIIIATVVPRITRAGSQPAFERTRTDGRALMSPRMSTGPAALRRAPRKPGRAAGAAGSAAAERGPRASRGIAAAGIAGASAPSMPPSSIVVAAR